MPTIHRVIHVAAPQQQVFDTLIRIEHYPRYSRYIKRVEQVAPSVYRWRAGLWGLSMEWEGALTEVDAPNAFHWECTKGFKNTGSLQIRAHGEHGTRVEFNLDYAEGHRLVDRVVKMLLGPKADQWLSEQILDAVKTHLASPI